MTHVVVGQLIPHSLGLCFDKAVLRQRVAIGLPQWRQMPNDNCIETVLQARISLESVQLEEDLARNVAHRARKVTEIAVHFFFVQAIRAEARDF